MLKTLVFKGFQEKFGKKAEGACVGLREGAYLGSSAAWNAGNPGTVRAGTLAGFHGSLTVLVTSHGLPDRDPSAKRAMCGERVRRQTSSDDAVPLLSRREAAAGLTSETAPRGTAAGRALGRAGCMGDPRKYPMPCDGFDRRKAAREYCEHQ